MIRMKRVEGEMRVWRWNARWRTDEEVGAIVEWGRRGTGVVLVRVGVVCT